MPPPEPSDSIIVGRIVGPHGKSGTVRVVVMSDVPDRFSAGKVLYVDGNPHTVQSSGPMHRKQVLLKFVDVDSLEAAQALAAQSLTIPLEQVPSLPEGEYYHYQLLGLKVVTEEGEDLGLLKEILETGSNDVYLVSGSDGEILIPALAGVIRKVEVDQGVMVVRLLDGLR